MASVSDRSRLDDQINKLKEIKEKKEKGLDYKFEDISVTAREYKNKSHVRTDLKSRDNSVNNPFVRKISLDELINISKLMKGEKIISHEKKTPFINKEKEIKTPEMDKHGM